MQSLKTRSDFVNSDEGRNVKQILESMATSEVYNTTSTYSTNSTLYPDNLIPFVDKHMNYLIKHPELESSKYLANIKLMTRARVS